MQRRLPVVRDVQLVAVLLAVNAEALIFDESAATLPVLQVDVQLVVHVGLIGQAMDVVETCLGVRTAIKRQWFV